jgi:hypothetical protein
MALSAAFLYKGVTSAFQNYLSNVLNEKMKDSKLSEKEISNLIKIQQKK